VERRRVVEDVEAAVDRATAPEHPRKYADSDEPTNDPDELRTEQRRESREAWVGPGIPVMSDAQLKGGLFGALAGGLIGMVLLLPLGFIPWGDLDLVWRLVVAGITGALAGGTAGALYWGGREPELEGETVDADNRPSVGTSLRDPSTDERGR
jgi:hypothetical protein